MRKNGAIRKVVNLQIKQKKKNGNNGKSKLATLALAQGVAQVTRRPFQIKSSASRRVLDYFNATLPAHLPLPRAVGPYTIVRTTQVVSSSAYVNFFSFIASEDMGTGHIGTRWLAACGVGSALAGSINAAGTTRLHPMVGLDSLYLAAMISPAAITVQVMNPNALQTTSGITYLGRSTAQYELANSSRTWDMLGNEFVQFMAPRLCSAGKLALRGVTLDSYPLDMSEVSDFRGIRPFGEVGDLPQWVDEKIRPAGFAPIVCYNPNAVPLQFLVTMEWRVRFDPSNPAAGSHSYHGTAPDSTWDSITRRAASMGHGALDIAEKVAEVGTAGIGALESGAIAFA
jgi:hypothetical protein